MAEGERTDYRSLGEILRDARTAQGKSVKDMAEITKISPHAIAALEADDIDQLAGPVYARSFTRNLAESLGLDPEFLLAKLALTTPAAPIKSEIPSPELPRHSAPVVPQTQIPKNEESKDASTWHIETVRVTRVTATNRPRLDRRIVAAAVVVILAIVLWLLLSPRVRGGSEEGRRADLPSAQADLMAPPMQQIPALQDSSAVGALAREDDEALREEIVPASSIRPTRGPATSEPAGPQIPPQQRADAPATESSVVRQPEESASRQDIAERPAEADDSQPDALARQTRVREEETVATESRGLASIERPGGEDPTQVARLVLLIQAERRVEVWAAADGRQRRRRILGPGEVWRMEGSDHFSLEIEDVDAVVVFFDGVRRDPPPDLTTEWLLHPIEPQR